MAMLEKIRAIVAEQALLEPGDVADDATLEGLGIDSLGIVEIIYAIEEEFSIEVPFNANEPDTSDFDISSLPAIATAVSRLVAEQAG